MSKAVSKKFGRALIGNNIISLNKRKSRLNSNSNLHYKKDNNVYGNVMAREGKIFTFENFRFVNHEGKRVDVDFANDLRIKFETEKSLFKDMSLYSEIESISLINSINGNSEFKIFEIQDDRIIPSEYIFEIIELFYERYEIDLFYTLICFIDLIIKSNEVYIHYKYVTTKNEPITPLNYNDGCEAYQKYLSVKTNNAKYKLSNELNIPNFGKLDKFELMFVNCTPLINIEKLSDKIRLLSANWNS
jgi:hypothetical protein